VNNKPRTTSLRKLLRKLNHIVMLPFGTASPRRSWESAATREIQLELDLEQRCKQGQWCAKGFLGCMLLGDIFVIILLQMIDFEEVDMHKRSAF